MNKNIFFLLLIVIFISIICILIYKLFNKFIYINFSNTINKKKFITFGGGNNNYIEAGERLINQANSLNLFDNTILYTDKYLINDKDFWNKHGNFILKNKRGYGYWLWKPYIIKITMDKMNDGDILLYLDCGCEINNKKHSLMSKLFEEVKEYNIIKTTTQIEKEWNKMDLILKMNMNDEKWKTYKKFAVLRNPYDRFISFLILYFLHNKLNIDWSCLCSLNSGTFGAIDGVSSI